MNNTKRLLENGLVKLGFIPDENILNLFLRYLSEIQRWNKVINLTGIKEEHEIIIKHFFDSLLYAKVLPENTKVLADIGTGAGFPGLPIKLIFPEIELYLIEPSVKKSTFLEHIIKTLKLENITIFTKRIGEIKSKELAVDVVVTRALFKVDEFIKKSTHILKNGGSLIISKGPRYAEEIKNIEGYNFAIHTFEIPFSNIKRNLITVLKR